MASVNTKSLTKGIDWIRKVHSIGARMASVNVNTYGKWQVTWLQRELIGQRECFSGCIGCRGSFLAKGASE